ncbi:SNARE-associated protein Snapin-like isoform X1 [Amphiura filiformis]|uniref:SNARE-associated protein Snapin-like isoform X1 n=1 Tax=Amphiura filiformis TaxID=82378 RepID=UPI003B20C03D
MTETQNSVTEEVETPSLTTEGRDAIAAGILELLKPAVQEVDDRVKSVRESQLELRQQIEDLDEVLKQLSQEREPPVELDAYVKKLMNSKRRIGVVNNIVQNAQDRVVKLQQKLMRDSSKRFVQLHMPQPPLSNLLETEEIRTDQ